MLLQLTPIQASERHMHSHEHRYVRCVGSGAPAFAYAVETRQVSKPKDLSFGLVHMGKARRRIRPNRGTDAAQLNQNRTREERETESRKIMEMLTSLDLTMAYDGVRELLPVLSKYVEDGVRTEVKIDISEIGRRIVGVLATSRREEVWLKLEKL